MLYPNKNSILSHNNLLKLLRNNFTVSTKNIRVLQSLTCNLKIKNFLQPLTCNLRTFQFISEEKVVYIPLYNQMGFTLMPVSN